MKSKRKKRQQDRNTISKIEKRRIMKMYNDKLDEFFQFCEINSNDVRTSYGRYYFHIHNRLNEVMEIISKDFNGSRFGHDAVRIEGSIDFIKTAMIMLSPLFSFDKIDDYCLETFMLKLDPKEIIGDKNPDGNWVLYIRVKEGGENNNV